MSYSYNNLTAITQQRYDVYELSMRSMICLCITNEKSMRLIEALLTSLTNPWSSSMNSRVALQCT